MKESEKNSTILEMSDLGKSILRLLLYHQVFTYPLTLEEIQSLIGVKNCVLTDVEAELDLLLSEKMIYCIEGFYSVQAEEKWVRRRKEGNQRAKEYIKKARRISRIIACFPFVRAIFLSGSLSKNYVDEKSDIDYFIITEPNRLWFVRMLFILFKRTILLNSNKYFCFNYLIDSAHLEISDKSFYTAIETVTLMPVYGKKLYLDFMHQNRWAKNFFPNFPLREITPLSEEKKPLLRNLLEMIFRLGLFDHLENYLLQRSIRRWTKRYPLLYNNAIGSVYFNTYVSKGHSNDHYERIMQNYRCNIEKFEQFFNLKITF